MLSKIIVQALTETVVDIGQLNKSEKYQLNKAVKKGWLSKGLGGPFPKLKTVYAHPCYDFEAHRAIWVERMMNLTKASIR